MVYRRFNKSRYQKVMENFKLNLAIKALLCATIVLLIIGGALLAHAMSQGSTTIGNVQAFFIAGIFFLCLGGLCFVATIVCCAIFVYVHEKNKEQDDSTSTPAARNVQYANGTPQRASQYGNGEDNPMFTDESGGNAYYFDKNNVKSHKASPNYGEISIVSGKTNEGTEGFAAAPQYREYQEYYPRQNSNTNGVGHYGPGNNSRPQENVPASANAYRPRHQQLSPPQEEDLPIPQRYSPARVQGESDYPSQRYPGAGRPGSDHPREQYQYPGDRDRDKDRYQPQSHTQPSQPNAYRPRNYSSNTGAEEYPMTEYPSRSQRPQYSEKNSANERHYPEDNRTDYQDNRPDYRQPPMDYSGRSAAYRPGYSESDDHQRHYDNYRGDNSRETQRQYDEPDRHSQQQTQENYPRPYRPRQQSNDSPPPSYNSQYVHS